LPYFYKFKAYNYYASVRYVNIKAKFQGYIMDETLPVEPVIEQIGLLNLMEKKMTDTCVINQNDVARETSLERNAIAQSAQAERLGLENLNATQQEGSEGRDTTEQFGFQNLNSVQSEGSQNRDTTEQFGFQNLGATQHASDLNVTASQAAQDAAQTYGYRNVVATKDAEKEILETICESTAGLSAAAREILMSQSGGFKDVLLQSAQNTDALQMSMCSNTKDILLQAAGNTASIKTQSANEFKDVLLQAAGNTANVRSDLANGVKDIQLQACSDTDAINSQSASQFKDSLLQAAAIAKDAAVAACVNAAAVALQNTLNAKDAEISAVSNAKDAALTAAVNFEKLYAQGDRNTAALQSSIAECCCENKALLIERTDHTDALIRALDEGRVKEELLAARFKILALENKIPTVAVAA
jgi:hypothetical protein